MHSCLYHGHVIHRRHVVRQHQFRYGIFMWYLDLEELDGVFKKRWYWSQRPLSPIRFRREDHFGDPSRPLADCVRELLEREAESNCSGPIRLLTNMRHAGYVMNPVSFYYCFDEQDGSLQNVVAEVHNTPWNEQHCYVLSRSDFAGDSNGSRTEKSFHVSPFMPMDMSYSWSLSAPDESLQVSIQNWRHGKRVFDAALRLEQLPITTKNMLYCSLRYPLMPQRVWLGIYWQALRLWMKGVPYHPHPKTREAKSSAAEKAGTR